MAKPSLDVKGDRRKRKVAEPEVAPSVARMLYTEVHLDGGKDALVNGTHGVFLLKRLRVERPR